MYGIDSDPWAIEISEETSDERESSQITNGQMPGDLGKVLH